MKLYQQAYLFTAWECLQLQAGTIVLFFNIHLFLQCLIFRSFLFYSYLTLKQTKTNNYRQTKTQLRAQPDSIAFFPVTLNINFVLLNYTGCYQSVKVW